MGSTRSVDEMRAAMSALRAAHLDWMVDIDLSVDGRARVVGRLPTGTRFALYAAEPAWSLAALRLEPSHWCPEVGPARATA
jgi:hypothetical protein